MEIQTNVFDEVNKRLRKVVILVLIAQNNKNLCH